MAFFGAQLATQASFMALGEALVSLSMTTLRKIIILIPLAYILPIYFNIKGIYYAEVIADLIATIVTVLVFFILINKILNEKMNEIEISPKNYTTIKLSTITVD